MNVYLNTNVELNTNSCVSKMESIKSPTRQIRSQLEALLHCKKCFTQPCATLNCEEFKAVIVHMEACKEGRACQAS